MKTEIELFAQGGTWHIQTTDPAIRAAFNTDTIPTAWRAGRPAIDCLADLRDRFPGASVTLRPAGPNADPAGDATGFIAQIDGIDWEFIAAEHGTGWYATNEHGDVTAGLYPDPDDLADAIAQDAVEYE